MSVAKVYRQSQISDICLQSRTEVGGRQVQVFFMSVLSMLTTLKSKKSHEAKENLQCLVKSRSGEGENDFILISTLFLRDEF